MTIPEHEEEALLAKARAFADDDPDPSTAAELASLIDRRRIDELRARFAAPLVFGTAGLRGALGSGPARMNRAVVARTTAGLCAYLLANEQGARSRGVCIGFDGRHMSRQFAEETAAVAAGLGFVVHLFEQPVPTPVLAFAVIDEKAAAGVMITASHNPASDNGYKAYWNNGAQVIPPHDRGIEQAMTEIVSVRALARRDPQARLQAGLARELGATTRERYLAAIAQHSELGPRQGRDVPIVYTAMHGVGGQWVSAALSRAGFTNVHSVAAQAEPDPDFPTVAFPNPEEPGALDQARALARDVGAVVVLANDPDADRLAVAARDATGALYVLTGNELGALLTETLLAREPGRAGRLVLSSIVSSPQISVIARAHGAHWEPTLTGFKWIANRAIELKATSGLTLVLGLEEAIGYSIGELVRDKDGVSSALYMACLAGELHARGQTLLDALDAVCQRHGAYVSGQVSLKAAGLDGPARMAAVMARARATPPQSIAGCAVSAVIDLADGTCTGTPSFDPRALPSSDVVIWELGERGRVALRPSGTEPKLKLYVDAASRVQKGEPVSAARARAREQMAAMSAEATARLGL